MKSFLVIAEQSGGCDYTIGCGIKYWMEDAESIEELKGEIEKKLLGLKDDYDGNYSESLPRKSRFSSEYAYDELTIYELSDNMYSFNLDSLSERLSLIEKNEEKKKLEEEELRQYEKLKKKFEEEPPIIEKECLGCKVLFIQEDKEVRCVSCQDSHKQELRYEKEYQEKIAKQRTYLFSLMKNDGWEEANYNELYYRRHLVKGKYRVSSDGSIEIWDLILPGKRKPTWRTATLSEIINEMPDDAREFIKESPCELLVS